MIKKTAPRLQVNPIECAAVALGIILDYYNYNIASHKLNNLVGVSRFGTDANALMRAGEFCGLKAYAQKILLSDLKKTKNLSVLFVDNSHFVVFEGYLWGRFYINDPALGRYSLRQQELRKRLNGVQIIFEPTPEFLKNAPQKPSQKFMGGLGLLVGSLLGILLLSFASNYALSIFEPVKYVSPLLFFLIVLTFLYALFIKLSYLKLRDSYAQSACSWLVTHISQSGLGFFTTRPFAGFALTLKNLSTLKNLDSPMFFLNTILCACSAVIILGLTFVYWLFGLIALALFLARLALGFLNTPRKSLALPNFLQAFEHYPDLAVMGQQKQLINEQMAFTSKAQASFQFSALAYFNFAPTWLALPMIFYWGSLGLERGLLTSNEIYLALILVFFVSYFAGLLTRNLDSPRQNQDLALLGEIGDLALYRQQSSPTANSKHLLEIKNGFFRYPGESKEVFKNFNLILERSKIYAVKAPPMAGISTLLKLVGQKLVWTKADQKLESARLSIALIDDEADLFDGSLLENMRLFNRDISEEQVVIALRLACAEELFYQRPLGLLAPIYAGGANVSGGQKKRLLLARALIHKPDLIILDDFFEALELELALRILKNLKSVAQSVIFSSQRPEENFLADELISWEAQA